MVDYCNYLLLVVMMPKRRTEYFSFIHVFLKRIAVTNLSKKSFSSPANGFIFYTKKMDGFHLYGVDALIVLVHLHVKRDNSFLKLAYRRH